MARENTVQRMEEQQQDLLHHREARSDPQYQAREQQINNMHRQQVGSSRLFKVAKEIFEQQDIPTNVKIVINETKRPSVEHSRRYNRPLSDEMGVLMPIDVANNRDI